jgi:hypothetical protein
MLKIIVLLTSIASGQTMELTSQESFGTMEACMTELAAASPTLEGLLEANYGAKKDVDYTIKLECQVVGRDA